MLTYSHDIALFIASVVVSFVAAFTGLALTDNISRFTEGHRKALIVMSAFILGGGIWSMHFVAMLAVKIDHPVYYDLLQTLGSALVAILVAGFALLLLHFATRTPAILTFAGLILGLGIVAMHFIGMLGMRGLTPVFNILSVWLTVSVAVITGVAAIWAAYGSRSRQNIIAGAAVFGFAVVAVHFTAMHGTGFVSGPAPDSSSVFIGDGTLAVTVTVTVFVICGTFLLAATTFITRQDLSVSPALIDHVSLTESLIDRPKLARDSASAIQSSYSSGQGADSSLEIPSKSDALADRYGPGKQELTESLAGSDGRQTEDIEPVERAAPVKIPFERGKKTFFISSNEVAAIRADGRYTHLYAHSGTHFCPWSITEAENRLAEAGYFRTHRSYLVNLQQLSGFQKSKDTGVCLFDSLPQLSGVPVSRKRIPSLVGILGI